MAWDFETDPDFQEELDWIDAFVRENVEPLDHILGDPYDLDDPDFQRVVRPLQQQVRKRRLWACHLDPELGGPGYGQLKLGLMNEILGRSRFAPIVFGCQAPDSGNGEILAHKQMVQEKIADSWVELEQFRLLVLCTAWKIDKLKDYMKVRKDIAAIKAVMPAARGETLVCRAQGSAASGEAPPTTAMPEHCRGGATKTRGRKPLRPLGSTPRGPSAARRALQ